MMSDKGTPVLAAVCGLYCGGCALYIATQRNDIKTLAQLAETYGTAVENLKCDGCRSGRVSSYCGDCGLIKCASEKGYQSCGECDENSTCELLVTFQKAKPDRKDIRKDFKRISEVGVHAWVAEMRQRYACPACGYPNSAYDLKCRKCGHEPANAYVAEHMDEIKEHLKDQKNG